MKPAAVLFDVYQTLLEVGPPPADAAERWCELWQRRLAGPPRLSLPEFGAQCEEVIAREHLAAKAQGVAYPEVYWPAVTLQVLPELGRLTASERDEFLYQQTDLWHTVRPMPGAEEVLRFLVEKKVLLGIFSNAQPYTLRELDRELATVGLSSAIFDPGLVFWSFEHGFSKPDPYAFRLIATRLRLRGISPDRTLLVGDRLDNDIAPARAQGWHTWLLTEAAAPDQAPQGNLHGLLGYLRQVTP